jgi:hypothetical protein
VLNTSSLRVVVAAALVQVVVAVLARSHRLAAQACLQATIPSQLVAVEQDRFQAEVQTELQVLSMVHHQLVVEAAVQITQV